MALSARELRDLRKGGLDKAFGAAATTLGVDASASSRKGHEPVMHSHGEADSGLVAAVRARKVARKGVASTALTPAARIEPPAPSPAPAAVEVAPSAPDPDAMPMLTRADGRAGTASVLGRLKAPAPAAIEPSAPATSHEPSAPSATPTSPEPSAPSPASAPDHEPSGESSGDAMPVITRADLAGGTTSMLRRLDARSGARRAGAPTTIEPPPATPPASPRPAARIEPTPPPDPIRILPRPGLRPAGHRIIPHAPPANLDAVQGAFQRMVKAKETQEKLKTIGGKLWGMLPGTDRTFQTFKAQEEFRKAQEDYERLAQEYIANDVHRFLEVQEKRADSYLQARHNEMGGTGSVRRLFNAQKSLGQYNLESAVTKGLDAVESFLVDKRITSKKWFGWAGRIAGRALSARTAVSATIMGAGAVMGGPWSLGAFAFTRMVGRANSSVAAYDMIGQTFDHWKFKAYQSGLELMKDQLPGVTGKARLQDYSLREIEQVMGSYEAHTLAYGSRPHSDTPGLKELRAHYEIRLRGEALIDRLKNLNNEMDQQFSGEFHQERWWSMRKKLYAGFAGFVAIPGVMEYAKGGLTGVMGSLKHHLSHGWSIINQKSDEWLGSFTSHAPSMPSVVPPIAGATTPTIPMPTGVPRVPLVGGAVTETHPTPAPVTQPARPALASAARAGAPSPTPPAMPPTPAGSPPPIVGARAAAGTPPATPRPAIGTPPAKPYSIWTDPNQPNMPPLPKTPDAFDEAIRKANNVAAEGGKAATSTAAAAHAAAEGVKGAPAAAGATPEQIVSQQFTKDHPWLNGMEGWKEENHLVVPVEGPLRLDDQRDVLYALLKESSGGTKASEDVAAARIMNQTENLLRILHGHKLHGINLTPEQVKAVFSFDKDERLLSIDEEKWKTISTELTRHAKELMPDDMTGAAAHAQDLQAFNYTNKFQRHMEQLAHDNDIPHEHHDVPAETHGGGNGSGGVAADHHTTNASDAHNAQHPRPKTPSADPSMHNADIQHQGDPQRWNTLTPEERAVLRAHASSDRDEIQAWNKIIEQDNKIGRGGDHDDDTLSSLASKSAGTTENQLGPTTANDAVDPALYTSFKGLNQEVGEKTLPSDSKFIQEFAGRTGTLAQHLLDYFQKNSGARSVVFPKLGVRIEHLGNGNNFRAVLDNGKTIGVSKKLAELMVKRAQHLAESV